MGDVIPFPMPAEHPLSADPKAEHQLRLRFVDNRKRVRASCNCGLDLLTWRPEDGEARRNVTRVRGLYRKHIADTETQQEVQA